MITIENVIFNPNAATQEARSGSAFDAHSLADPGGIATLALFVVGFVLPMILVAQSPRLLRFIGPTVEIRALVWVSFLALLLPVAQIVLHIRRFGGSAIRGNRETYPRTAGVLGRVARAHTNTIESLVPFASVILACQSLHLSNRWTVAAAAVYLGARYVHSLCYLFGVTVLRSAAFYGGLIATVVVGWQIALS